MYLLFVLLSFLASPVLAYETVTHAAFSAQAVDPEVSPNLHRFFTDSLRLRNGYRHELGARQVVSWLEMGSADQDRLPLVCNHFHDPTRSWSMAGATGPWCRLAAINWPSIPLGLSSVVWAQREFHSASNPSLSWQDARAHYYEALVASNSEAREEELSQMFLSLGHVIHHVQDAASPAHVRNDEHFSPFGCTDDGEPRLDGDRFHCQAATSSFLSIVDSITETSVIRFDTAIFAQQGDSDPDAPLPFGRIIDATRGDRLASVAGAPPMGRNVGMAEYTNAGFFSDDTVDRDVYRYPEIVDYRTVPVGADGLRRYAFRQVYAPDEGSQTEIPVATPTALQGHVALTEVALGLDNQVLIENARLIFPRAVGYSAGLLQTFFRGQIEVSLSLSALVKLASHDHSPISLTLRNVTEVYPGEQPGLTGEIRVVVAYRDSSGRELYSLSSPVTGSIDETDEDYVFEFPGPPVPEGATLVAVSAVFLGRLGLEERAVAIGTRAVDVGEANLIQPPDRGVYAIALDAASNAPNFRQLRARVGDPSNVTQGREAQVRAFVRYRRGSSGVDVIEFPDSALGPVEVAMSLPVAMTLSAQHQDMTFTFPGGGVPAEVADVEVGVLVEVPVSGSAPAITALAITDVREPTPFGLMPEGFNHEYVCPVERPYTPIYVGDKTCADAYDVNGDGRLDFAGQTTWSDVFVKVTSTNGESLPVSPPNATDFDVSMPLFSPGTYARFLVLADDPGLQFNVTVTVETCSWVDMLDRNAGAVETSVPDVNFEFYAVTLRNDVEITPGGAQKRHTYLPVPEVTLPLVMPRYRGVSFYAINTYAMRLSCNPNISEWEHPEWLEPGLLYYPIDPLHDGSWFGLPPLTAAQADLANGS